MINILKNYYPLYLSGALVTLKLSFFGVIFGTLIGILIALAKLSKSKILSFISTAYVELVRGTPLLVQIIMIYYGLSYALPDFFGFFKSRTFLGGLAICINSAAYVAEIIRAGINSVDKGQVEAAKSLGMNEKLTMRYIIIPQAVKNILPALGNEFVVLVKETAIISTIAIQDLTYNATKVQSMTFSPFAPLAIAALMYFVMTFTLSKLVGKFERRLKASD